MDRMKIAFIVAQFPVGSETFILNQIVGLLDRGHQVDIYASDRGNLTKVPPLVTKYNLLDRVYYFHPVPNNFLWRILRGIVLLLNLAIRDPGKALKAINVFKYGQEALSLWLLYSAIPGFKATYDVIHCQFGYEGFRSMAFQTMNDPSAKSIVAFRGYDLSGFLKIKGKGVYRQLFTRADLFLPNCDRFRSLLIDIGCPIDRIAVHRSGIDCSQFPFNPRSFPPDNRVRMVSIGRFVEKKGIEYSIRAFAKISPLYPEAEYQIIGDGVLKPQLASAIAELGMGDRIQLISWKKPSEIVEILALSHIFIAPSVTAADGDTEGIPNVLKEAMAMGMPAIATRHAGIPELVEDGVSGFLVPERDIESLAEKMSYLCAHPEIWEPMAKAARSQVEKDYDIHKLNEELVEIYRHLRRSELSTTQNRVIQS